MQTQLNFSSIHSDLNPRQNVLSTLVPGYFLDCVDIICMHIWCMYHYTAYVSLYGVVLCVGAQSYPTLCDAMDCSPSASSVHVISQARLLEWVAISCSRGSSQSMD